MQRLLPADQAVISLTVQLALVSYLLSDSELLIALQIAKGQSTLERLGNVLPLDPLTLKRAVISMFERGYLATQSR